MQRHSPLSTKQVALLSFFLILILGLYLFTENLWIVGGTVLLILLLALLFVRRKKSVHQSVPADIALQNAPVTFTPIKSDLRLRDVAGLDDVKDELFEIKDFLNAPSKYKKFGARIPKGILLVGPPGVGKTMIAKALAGEAGVPFFYQSGASFVEIYVGMGAKKVHDLFSIAKKNAPSIIFIDEIDSVGKARGGNRNDEREATLNQLLTEMDGFDSGSGVVVIAATNKVEMLDTALLRAGRFDRHVHLGLPSIEDRESILDIHLKSRPHSVDVKRIAFITSGFSGATLENLVNEASLFAIRNKKKRIETEDFMAVKDKVLFGKKQQTLFSLEEKETIAFYQSAKAVIAKELGLFFEKITLFENSFIPESLNLESDKVALNKIAAQIAGIIAYDLQYSTRYSNIQSDIRIAEAEIHEYLKRFNLEKNATFDSVLEEAKDIAAKSFKSCKEAIISLQERLMASEVICFNDL